MKTKADRMKQATAVLDRALYKRRTAQKLLAEAEEEIVQARIMLEDLDHDKG